MKGLLKSLFLCKSFLSCSISVFTHPLILPCQQGSASAWWIKSDLFLSLTLFGLETDHLSIIEGRDRREGKLTTNCNIH